MTAKNVLTGILALALAAVPLTLIAAGVLMIVGIRWVAETAP